MAIESMSFSARFRGDRLHTLQYLRGECDRYHRLWSDYRDTDDARKG